ncbi:MAG: hypothetical protein K0R65_2774 [Crocinitomicaceae bacterium]|jgi:signal transduction histidine kinase|nr:hypothetical protein [Crocinitomicaceae bacterium]
MKAQIYLLFFSFSLFFLPVSAQGPVGDSLLQLIGNTKEDTTKIRLYYDYGLYKLQSDTDSAAFYYKKARKLSEKTGNIKGQITYAGLYGTILNEQGKLQESLELSRKALVLTEKYHLDFERAKTSNNIANVFNYMGEFDSSMVYFLQAVRIFKKIRREEHLNVIYQNMGTVYLNMRDYPKSIEYFRKSIDLSRTKNDQGAIAYTLTNLGGAYVSLGKYEKAYDAFSQSLEICKTNPQIYTENLAYLGLGNVYTQQKKYDDAVRVLEKARKDAESFAFTSNLANALNALAVVYYEKQNYPEANRYALEAVKINEQYQVYNNLSQQYKLLSDIHSKLGKHASAYTYLKKYVHLNDSLSGIEEKKHVARLEKEYKTAEKDRQIAENKLQIELNEKSIRQKNSWLLASLGIVVFLVLCLLFAFYLAKQRKKMHRQKLLDLEKDRELRELKATLEGQQKERQRIAREMHDEIGSGLSVIHLLSNNLGYSNEKTVKVAETSGLLINQMNEIIWSMNLEQDNLEDFVSYIRYQSGQLLSSVNLDFVFDIPDEVPQQPISGIKRRNLYLVVKEALHNCIKHSGASQVKLGMNFEKGIAISISDNGRGIPENNGNPYGNGMKNMLYRMQEIGGEWKISSYKPFTIEIHLAEERLL